MILSNASLASTNEIESLFYSVKVYDEYINKIGEGYLYIYLIKQNDVIRLNYEIDIQSLKLPKTLIDKATAYPDISTYLLTEEELRTLQMSRKVKTNYGDVVFIDYVPFVLADGKIVKAIYCIYYPVEGGFFRSDYDAISGALVYKEMGFKYRDEVFYLRISLLNSTMSLNYMTVNTKNIILLRNLSLLLVVLSIIVLIFNKKFRIS